MGDELIVRGESRQAEVSDADFTLGFLLDLVDQDVLQLNVTMDDVLFLEQVQSEKGLLHDDTDICLIELHVLLQGGHQGALGLVIQNHVDEICILIESEQLKAPSAVLHCPVYLDLINKELDSGF